MPRESLDELDRKILCRLIGDARKPFLEIARECGVSGAAIHQRVQKLVALGVIQGFETLISPEVMGYDTCAYIGVFVNDPSTFDSVAEQIRNIPEVVEMHYTTGKYDILLKLYARNNQHLLQLIHDKLQAIVSARTETLISFKEDFRRQLPIDI